MDLLQIALIFLICLLSVFLSVTGIQVFLILRGLRKGLDEFNKMLAGGGKIVEAVEKPITATVKVIEELTQKSKSPQKPKFYKKIMK